jgi:hypothetical protein
MNGLETGPLGLRIRLHAVCLASIISKSLAALLETSLQSTAPPPNSQLPTLMDAAMSLGLQSTVALSTLHRIHKLQC